MELYLELNQKHGCGFQLHIVHGPVNKVYDEEPWNMYEAGACAGVFVEEFNREFGADYKVHQVLRVTDEALEANAKTDFAAARILHDIKSEKFELSTPESQDFKTDENGQCLVSGRGTVLLYLFLWLDDGSQKARDGLRRYCEYISLHGYRGGAKTALKELDLLTKDGAVTWIRQTYARHVHDDAALMQYVLRG